MGGEVALQDRENAVAWELRGAWATGRPVRLLLQAEAGAGLIVGTVNSVAPSAAYAILQPIEDPERMSTNDVILDAAGAYEPPEPIHVPLMYVSEVRAPHFHVEPLHWTPRAGTAYDGQLPLDGQGILGAEHAPPVSARSQRTMTRAVLMMLPRDQLQVLAALDRVTFGAPRGKKLAQARTWMVAGEVGRTPRWTARRLRALHRQAFVDVMKDGRAVAWRIRR